MPQSRKNPSARLDPRKPLVFSTLDLGRSPGSEYSQKRTVPAPAYVQAGLVGVAEGSDVELDVRMEAVSEGVLVTATARAQVTGECARCLEPISEPVEVQAQELFAYATDDGEADAEGYALLGDLLDFEPVLQALGGGRSEEGVHRQPDRRRRPGPGHFPDVQRVRQRAVQRGLRLGPLRR